jgi:hypothetical protein
MPKEGIAERAIKEEEHHGTAYENMFYHPLHKDCLKDSKEGVASLLPGSEHRGGSSFTLWYHSKENKRARSFKSTSPSCSRRVSGLSTDHASFYFSLCSKKYRKGWVKVTIVADCLLYFCLAH